MIRHALLGLFAFLALLVPAQASSQNIVNPRASNGTFKLGPYPVKADLDGIPVQLYTTLIFQPVIEGRGNPTYKLNLIALVQLTDLGPAVKRYVMAKYSQNNCERVNNVDNWVYSVKSTTLRVVDRRTLRISSVASVQTWTCTEGLPETVCETYKDSFGFEWPKNCKMRPTRYKVMNFEQGAEVTKDTWVDSTPTTILFKNFDPVIKPDNNTVLQNILNKVFRDLAKTDATIANNAALSATSINAAVPSEYLFLNPRIEEAGFNEQGGEPFLYGRYSVSIEREQINSFMSRYFGSLWDPITAPATAASTAPALTKAQVRSDCADYLKKNPGDTIEHCAALHGLPYADLPD
jgi:hypothetical protein